MKITSGPAIERSGDLAAMLSNLAAGRRPVHRRDPPHRPARRGTALHGDGGLPGRRRRRQGARARPRSRWRSARSRWSAPPPGPGCSPARCATGSASSARWSSTSRPSCELVLARSAALLGVELTDDGSAEIAGRSRGTPRIANRLLRRVRDYAEVRGRRPGHPRGRPGRARRSTTSTTSAWTGSTAPCSRRWSPVRRRTGRRRDPRGRRGGGAEHGRGGLRAVPRAGRAARPDAPAGGWPPRPPGATSASPLPRGGCPARWGRWAISGLTGAPPTPGASSEPLFDA